MTTKNGTLHAAFVLDRSGSMSHLKKAVESGVDEYVSELRRDGGETLFSLTAFDTRVEHLHVATPLAEVPSLTKTGYEPGGMTALYDAVAHTILTTDERLRTEGRDAEKVMVAVLTDGLENASTDYTAPTIRDLIRAYDGRPNWTFVYLGAAHEDIERAKDAAEAMSFERGNAMVWRDDDAGARKSMASLANATNYNRRAPGPKTRKLFEDAGQAEADYRGAPS